MGKKDSFDYYKLKRNKIQLINWELFLNKLRATLKPVESTPYLLHVKSSLPTQWESCFCLVNWLVAGPGSLQRPFLNLQNALCYHHFSIIFDTHTKSPHTKAKASGRRADWPHGWSITIGPERGKRGRVGGVGGGGGALSKCLMNDSSFLTGYSPSPSRPSSTDS